MIRPVLVLASAAAAAFVCARFGVDHWGLSPHMLRLNALIAAGLIAAAVGLRTLSGPSSR